MKVRNLAAPLPTDEAGERTSLIRLISAVMGAETMTVREGRARFEVPIEVYLEHLDASVLREAWAHIAQAATAVARAAAVLNGRKFALWRRENEFEPPGEFVDAFPDVITSDHIIERLDLHRSYVLQEVDAGGATCGGVDGQVLDQPAEKVGESGLIVSGSIDIHQLNSSIGRVASSVAAVWPELDPAAPATPETKGEL